MKKIIYCFAFIFVFALTSTLVTVYSELNPSPEQQQKIFTELVQSFEAIDGSTDNGLMEKSIIASDILKCMRQFPDTYNEETAVKMTLTQVKSQYQKYELLMEVDGYTSHMATNISHLRSSLIFMTRAKINGLPQAPFDLNLLEGVYEASTKDWHYENTAENRATLLLAIENVNNAINI